MSDHCEGCGMCCMHMVAPPFVPVMDDPIIAAMPPGLYAEVERYVDSPRYTAVGGGEAPCLWLDLHTGRCIHHEHRPGVCREYPVGGSACRSQRTSVGLTLEGLPVVSDDEDEEVAA